VRGFSARGFYTVTVRAKPETRFRVLAVRDKAYSPTVAVT
jgi:hypothetical protein